MIGKFPEELAGEPWTEHDEVIGDNMYDRFQVKGECDAATVSGWVMEQVGRVPEEGDYFQTEGLDVTVTQAEHRRVLEIRVRVLEEET